MIISFVKINKAKLKLKLDQKKSQYTNNKYSPGVQN